MIQKLLRPPKKKKKEEIVESHERPHSVRTYAKEEIKCFCLTN